MYKDVELIVYCICMASVKISVESVVESLVSRHENHFTSSRQGTEEHALEEIIIAENGLLIQHADSILEIAMENYWISGEKMASDTLFVDRRTSDYTREILAKLLFACLIIYLNYHLWDHVH